MLVNPTKQETNYRMQMLLDALSSPSDNPILREELPEGVLYDYTFNPQITYNIGDLYNYDYSDATKSVWQQMCAIDDELEEYYQQHYNKPYERIGEYGVCDNYQQVLDHIPHLIDSDEKFCVILTPVEKNAQPEDGGWRWSKWGEYIGNQKSSSEYLYYEPDIDLVFVYHIYRVL